MSCNNLWCKALVVGLGGMSPGVQARVRCKACTAVGRKPASFNMLKVVGDMAPSLQHELDIIAFPGIDALAFERSFVAVLEMAMPHGVSAEQVARWMDDGQVRAHLSAEAGYLDIHALNQQIAVMKSTNLSLLSGGGGLRRGDSAAAEKSPAAGAAGAAAAAVAALAVVTAGGGNTGGGNGGAAEVSAAAEAAARVSALGSAVCLIGAAAAAAASSAVVMAGGSNTSGGNGGAASGGGGGGSGGPTSPAVPRNYDDPDEVRRWTASWKGTPVTPFPSRKQARPRSTSAARLKKAYLGVRAPYKAAIVANMAKRMSMFVNSDHCEELGRAQLAPVHL